MECEYILKNNIINSLVLWLDGMWIYFEKQYYKKSCTVTCNKHPWVSYSNNNKKNVLEKKYHKKSILKPDSKICGVFCIKWAVLFYEIV